MRQRRAKEERKREKQIDEVNERQIGKIISRSANIDVTSNQQFPMVYCLCSTVCYYQFIFLIVSELRVSAVLR